MGSVIPLGQNTPLTMIASFTAESGSDQTRDGLSPTAPAAVYLTGGSQHLRNGTTGGNYALQIPSTESAFLPIPGGTITIREFVLCVPIWADGASFFYWGARAGGTVCGLQINSGNAPLLYRGGLSPVVLATGTTGLYPNNAYTWSTLHAYMDAAGFMRLRQFAYANVVLEYSGNTRSDLGENSVDAIEFEAGINGDARIDDVYLYARSIYFTAASGSTPSAGATITDGTSGATARADFVQVSGATGVFLVSNVSGAFGRGHTITSGGWSATASNDLGNDEASLWVPEIFGFPGTLDSDVQTQWSFPSSPPHYSLVNDWADTTTYVSTNTSAQTDVYGTAFSTLPGSAVVYGLVVSTLGQQNGSSITELVLGYNDGTSNEDASPVVLPASWGRNAVIWTNNQRTGSAFTIPQITALELRLGSLT